MSNETRTSWPKLPRATRVRRRLTPDKLDPCSSPCQTAPKVRTPGSQRPFFNFLLSVSCEPPQDTTPSFFSWGCQLCCTAPPAYRLWSLKHQTAIMPNTTTSQKWEQKSSQVYGQMQSEVLNSIFGWHGIRHNTIGGFRRVDIYLGRKGAMIITD